jgi:NADP-dependent 3-hydroxy acid dehydrogenase YdfG
MTTTTGIKNQVVIITCASSGIGEATARLLARQGAKVVLGARRADRLKRLADEIGKEGGQAAYAVLDVTSPPDNEAIVRLAKEKFGRDVVFLNAGLMPTSPGSALKTEEWNQAIDINIKGVLNGVAAVMPSFIAQKAGQVVATSSVAGLKAYPGSAVYGGTKWFVRDFMEVLRMESAMEGTNIRTATIIRPRSAPSFWAGSPTLERRQQGRSRRAGDAARVLQRLAQCVLCAHGE